MLILKIPRKVNGTDLREFILNNIKKFRRNQKHKYIKLRGEIAYSADHVYFIFEPYGLELAFALSILFKCKKHNIPCTLEASKPIDVSKVPNEVLEAAKQWSERKLQRKYYKLKNLKL